MAIRRFLKIRAARKQLKWMNHYDLLTENERRDLTLDAKLALVGQRLTPIQRLVEDEVDRISDQVVYDHDILQKGNLWDIGGVIPCRTCGKNKPPDYLKEDMCSKCNHLISMLMSDGTDRSHGEKVAFAEQIALVALRRLEESERADGPEQGDIWDEITEEDLEEFGEYLKGGK